MSIQALSSVFRDRIISSDIWPACSPDLNPRDFFFGGCLKNKVYSNNPQTEELKENIRREISNIPAEHLQKVNQNLFRQCKECLFVEGHHFEHFL
jgi:biotin synthase-related radical SAM superfamily protein